MYIRSKLLVVVVARTKIAEHHPLPSAHTQALWGPLQLAVAIVEAIGISNGISTVGKGTPRYLVKM